MRVKWWPDLSFRSDDLSGKHESKIRCHCRDCIFKPVFEHWIGGEARRRPQTSWKEREDLWYTPLQRHQILLVCFRSHFSMRANCHHHHHYSFSSCPPCDDPCSSSCAKCVTVLFSYYFFDPTRYLRKWNVISLFLPRPVHQSPEWPPETDRRHRASSQVWCFRNVHSGASAQSRCFVFFRKFRYSCSM